MRSLLPWMLIVAALAQGLQVRIEPPSATVRSGAQIRTVAQAVGGAAPYRFEWFVGTERTGEINQAKVWVLRRPGRYTVRVVATDRAGATGAAEAVLTVEEYGARLEGTDPVSVTVWGLTPPFAYQVFLGDRPQGPPRRSSSPQETFPRPQAPGVVQVRVTDANGVETWAVSGARPAVPATPTPGPGDDDFGGGKRNNPCWSGGGTQQGS